MLVDPKDPHWREVPNGAQLHGDLSEFNILLTQDCPVIIDLPQAVDAAGNNRAPRMLMRDMDNQRSFFGQYAPELSDRRHGPETWTCTPRVT